MKAQVCQLVKSAMKTAWKAPIDSLGEIGLLVNLAFACYDRRNGKINTRVSGKYLRPARTLM